jgi:hypothetical protein
MLLGDGERWLVAVEVFSAFLDESGTGDKSPIVTVAGFYGDKERWTKFRELWEPHSFGFHARYSDSCFEELCSAIEGSEINGIFVCAGKEEYKLLATEHMKTFLGNPYSVCAFLCALKICGEVQAPTAFVLEHGQPNLRWVKEILEAMMDVGGEPISSVTSARKQDFIELHPADFVSHAACFYPEHDSWLTRLSDARRLFCADVTAEVLKKAAPEITAIVKRAKNQRLKAKRNR